MSGCIIWMGDQKIEVANDFRKVSDSLIDNTSPDWITVHLRLANGDQAGEVLINGANVDRVQPCPS